MNARRPPELDPRRESEFLRQLIERARLWIPGWDADGNRPDFAQALLAVAARFQAEVAERLDRGGDKMALGFLDWLAIRGRSAIPARMPVVFKLADKAAAVTAPAPVQLTADAGGAQVVFETEDAVRLLPARLQMIVGTDIAADAYYLPPPGMSSLDPLDPLPTTWKLRSFAGPGAATLQLDPPLGLEADMLLEIGGQQFRVTKVNEDLVGIDPPFPAGAQFGEAGGDVVKVATFDPFGGRARNRQRHELYLGHPDLLNIASEAVIEVHGLGPMGAGISWEYWGKPPGADAPEWRAMGPGSSATALFKPKGTIEESSVSGLASRWIRASIDNVAPGAGALTADEITLVVNPADLEGRCPAAGEAGGAGVDGVVAMANTTPLELGTISYPLGREPRLFDAFYLGSDEAFSKHDATIRICADMADASFSSFAVLRRGDQADKVLAGVAKDGHLHLLRFDPSSGRLAPYPDRQPLRPPSPRLGGGPDPGLAVSLDPCPPFRPALWLVPTDPPGSDFIVAASAGASVWAWWERPSAPLESGWLSLGTVDAAPGLGKIHGLVYLAAGAGGYLFALLDGKLGMCNPLLPNPVWQEVKVRDGGVDVKLAKIAPIVALDGDMGSGTMAAGMLGVGVNGWVYDIFVPAVSDPAATCTRLFDRAVTDIAPAGVRWPTVTPPDLPPSMYVLLVVGVCEAADVQTLKCFLSTPGTLLPARADAVNLEGKVVGNAVEVALASGQPAFAVALAQSDEATAVAWWLPGNAATLANLMTTTIPAEKGVAAGAPTLLPQHVVVPANSSQVLVAPFDLARQLTFESAIVTAIVTPLSLAPLAAQDHIAVKLTGSLTEVGRIKVAGVDHGDETMYEMDGAFGDRQDGNAISVYRSSVTGPRATQTDVREIELAPGAPSPGIDEILLIRKGSTIGPYIVVNPIVDGTVTLDRDLPADPGVDVEYWRPEAARGEVRPLMKLNPFDNGAWDAGLLQQIQLVFPAATPRRQRGTAFKTYAGHPTLVVLEKEFTSVPTPAKFIVDGAIGLWQRQFGDTGSNPELSWEYWNGSAWWKLASLSDGTGHLKRSGKISFKVPPDLRATDWAGTTSHWIRARLIGGDYGQPRTVVTSTTNGNEVEQTVKRTLDDVHAPQVLGLRVQYAANKPVPPTHVLTFDSGAMRDQSDANRTDGAQVAVFTPLASALPSTAGAEAAESEPERALYLGFSGELAGHGVNLLALVEREQPFSGFAPLRVEALCGEHFVPVPCEDTTRALGESGLLSLSLTLPTVTTALFGESLCWLRLFPSRQPAGGGWSPALRGLYINAAWARACETMTRERLGSSTGAPGLALLLARPPLLQDTLELRVREPLSAEERDALLLADPDSVVSDVAPDLRGHWVRWRQTIDVDDAGPLDRVYSLDEASGEVRFGDGMHGAIPPIGRDTIVAFSYQRTEAAIPSGGPADSVPANAVAPRTSLNLVTPVEGVEAAFAADQSAGGAPPESADRVRRFSAARLRNRGRALTLADFELHTLQNSPDIAQARAFADRGVRVVIAMRGKDVRPGQAVKRELRRALLAVASPQFAAPGALRVEGPKKLRPLRISLEMRVETLADSGRLADQAKRALSAFFDPAQGGLDGQGWRLGADPAEDDVSLALLDAPGLVGMESIVFEEIAADGAVAWSHHVARDELVVLADDGVRASFVIVETEL
jgi:hypothetical protein